MKRKVLLIYPKIPDTFWSFKYSLKFIGKKSNFPPLGLLTVAALLPSDYDIRVIDMNVTPLKEKDILDVDLVFTSSMMVQKESLEYVIDLCNKLQKPVVAGGPYPSVAYEKIKGVDYFVLNEAEVTLPLFLKDLEEGHPQKVYHTESKPDITKTPPPRFDLLNIGKYSSMALQYSRGCPFNCEFCDIVELFGRITRTKTPAQFIQEMEILYHSGYRGSIFVVDDNFIGNKTNVKELLPKVIEWQKARHYPFLFFTEASVNLAADEDLMDLMVDAGFTMAFLGIETPVEKSLKESGKFQNMRIELLESVRKIQRKGIEVTGGFIIGFDNDPENIADLQIDFIQKSGIATAMTGLLTALPNTRLYKRLEAENRILKDSTGNNTYALTLNFVPKMEKEHLIESYKKVMTHIYTPKHYFERCLSLLENYPSSARINLGATRLSNIISYARAFFQSLVTQTFSSYGFYYWKFLLRVLFKKPVFFPKAVQMAIYGHHFFKMTHQEITGKIRLLELFKRFLENKVSELQKKWLSYPANKPFKIFNSIANFRNKQLPEMIKKYKEIASVSNQKIDKILYNLDHSARQYLQKMSGYWKENIQKLDKKEAQKLIQQIAQYKNKLIFGLKDKTNFIQIDVEYHALELMGNLENAIDTIILEAENLIHKRFILAKAG
jgi:radical SAM superfamily enzyme YgiQ (UPF0313 family)